MSTCEIITNIGIHIFLLTLCYILYGIIYTNNLRIILNDEDFLKN